MSSRNVTTASILVPSRTAYRAMLDRLHVQAGGAAARSSPTMAQDTYVPLGQVPTGSVAQSFSLTGLLKIFVDFIKHLFHPTPAPAPDPALHGSGPTLRRGSTGPAVTALQMRLKQLGYDPGPIDGAFGPKTLSAVKMFQAHEHLPAEGIVGPETWKQLGITVKQPKPPAGGASALAKVTPAQLAHLGATDKEAFFAALRPAAEEAEREYGVPAALTLAQAALESGWGAHAIGGYNIFGIKGTGPAGSVATRTQEYRNGHYVTITDNFAKYHDFYEAVVAHGKIFHNGYYNKAINGYKSDPSPITFARNVQGIYATDPSYASKIISIIRTYGLT